MKKISELLDNKLAGEAREHSSLAKTWHHAVGDTVAAVAMPLKIDGTCLIVGVSDNMWLSELSHMKDEIMENLAAKGMNVKDIRFVFRQAPRRKTKPVFVPRNLTDKEERTVKHMCSVIKDKTLRESAEKAMRAYFGKYSYDDFIGR
ncbi:DUF721 domain-containing protein [Geovibrio thiophilus]|uniref:DUF721 domain-containing protein n=1 Tax=Geovibrio thiophilus TaxID=139438 RepID=A0A410JVK9_9BACT|nr:DUF721 domain-containing protein [Geovibrio thiophilus]QAR32240.1 DUF721 domain-containing protein [Geovibrio thiophilus]